MIKFSQKAKYFLTGAVAMAVIIPLTVKAVDTIPLTFNEGDIISANIINTLLTRIGDVQRGYSSNQDIVGTWSCRTITTESNCTLPFDLIPNSTKLTKTQNVTFACNNSNGVCSYTAESFFPGSCRAELATSEFMVMNYELLNHWMPLRRTTGQDLGVFQVQKISPSSFNWYVAGQTLPNAYAECSKQGIPPSPVNNLDTSVSGSGVILTWTDQSSDETGFKIQRRLMSSETFSTLTTTAANATSYSDTGLTSGTYVYRVLATNTTNGDSISSSEVSVTIQ